MSYANDPLDLLREGLDVYAPDGDRLGEVGEISVGARSGVLDGQGVTEGRSYFRLKRNSGDDVWVPSDDIAEVTNDRVTLRSSIGDSN
ncbi:MAG: DUF2171 domain-containing protein [Chloroflexota bacterium]|nr:DUF2171 domain-containing protein [Chloroflexota bacterium]